MSSPVALAFTAAQLDYLAALDYCAAAWPTFNPRIGLALSRIGLVTLDPKPALTPAGIHAARLAHVFVKASPVREKL